MATKNRLIAAISPIIIESKKEADAKKSSEEILKVAKVYGGYLYTELREIEPNVYNFEIAFSNLEMYNHYLQEVRRKELIQD